MLNFTDEGDRYDMKFRIDLLYVRHKKLKSRHGWSLYRFGSSNCPGYKVDQSLRSVASASRQS